MYLTYKYVIFLTSYNLKTIIKNEDNTMSTARIAEEFKAQTDVNLPNFTSKKFLSQSKQERSLYVNSLLNLAAQHTITQDELENVKNSYHILSIGEDKPTFYLVTDNEDVMKILELYSPSKFKDDNSQSKYFPFSDNVYAIEIPTQVLRKRIRSEALSKLPGWTEAMKEDWHTQNILKYENEMPMMVLRLYAGNNTHSNNVTPATFYCDGNDVISQQLFNYALTAKTQILPIQFPKEGRKAIFRFNDVPFHICNAKLYNDAICGFMNIFTINRSIDFWSVNQSFRKDLRNQIQRTDLITDSTYGAYLGFDAIQSIIKKSDLYHYALVVPLNCYIQQSLLYQRSIPQMDRIKQENGSYASDVELDRALSYFSNRRIQSINQEARSSTGCFIPKQCVML